MAECSIFFQQEETIQIVHDRPVRTLQLDS